VALSDRDQATLDQIELGLRGTDSKLTARPAAGRTRLVPHRMLLLATAGIAVGLTLVLIGLISKMIVISILGFLFIVVAATATTSGSAELRLRWKRVAATRDARPPPERTQPAPEGDRPIDEI
jgi:hypothetical protein